MSYSLSISGHHNDPGVADAIDTLVREKGAEIVAAVRELDPDAVKSALFSGPTGSVNYLVVAEPADVEPAEDDAPGG